MQNCQFMACLIILIIFSVLVHNSMWETVLKCDACVGDVHMCSILHFLGMYNYFIPLQYHQR